MDYKIVEMTIKSYDFYTYERLKTEFIESFQNEVNKLLNNGYALAGGISITRTSSEHPSNPVIHFAQALIK